MVSDSFIMQLYKIITILFIDVYEYVVCLFRKVLFEIFGE